MRIWITFLSCLSIYSTVFAQTEEASFSLHSLAGHQVLVGLDEKSQQVCELTLNSTSEQVVAQVQVGNSIYNPVQLKGDLSLFSVQLQGKYHHDMQNKSLIESIDATLSQGRFSKEVSFQIVKTHYAPSWFKIETLIHCKDLKLKVQE
ncbi:MAG: hypothetical protein AAGB31_14795 [Bdellovibrio sp.]